MSSPKVFDIVKGLRSQTAGWEWSEIESGYVPFVINKALSMDMRAVLVVNEINKNLPAEWQYEFLRNALPKLRGRSEWIKAESNENAEQLAEYYQCSLNKAIDIANTLTETQIQHIKQKMMQIGGRA